MVNMKNYQLAPQTNKIANRQDYEYIVMSEDGKSEGLSFKDYLRIIRRRKWFIFSPLFITISIALLFVVSSEKTYNATTRLLIEEVGPRAILMQEARMQEARTSEHTVEFYNTQYEIIKSRSIAEEVVQTL